MPVDARAVVRARNVVFEAGQDKLIVLGWVSFASVEASLGASPCRLLSRLPSKSDSGKGSSSMSCAAQALDWHANVVLSSMCVRRLT